MPEAPIIDIQRYVTGVLALSNVLSWHLLQGYVFLILSKLFFYIAKLLLVPANLFLGFFTGIGHERGGIHTSITNRSPSILDHQAVLLEMVPWYFRVLLHTLEVDCVQYGHGGLLDNCAEDVG